MKASNPRKEPPLLIQGTGFRDQKAQTAKRPTTTSMRRCGSIGNLPKATIPPQPNSKAQGDCLCASSKQTTVISQDLLREQYTRSLEQQIQLLEIENNYLKSDGNRNSSQGQQKVVNIMSRGNELSMNGKDWCRLPSFHPPLDKVLGDRINQAVNTGGSFKLNKEQSFDTSYSNLPIRDLNQSRLLTSERNVISHSPDGHVSFRTVKPISPDIQLLNELEDKTREVEDLKDQVVGHREALRKREERINQLAVRLREAESDLSSRSEADTRDKRALMEEALELQRRLDDLTPVLAEKETRISKLEDEKEALVLKTRTITAEVSDLKLKLTERKREEELLKDRESTSKSEQKRLKEKIEEYLIEIEERKRREDDLLDELSDFKRKTKEVHMHHQNDRHHIDQLTNENTKLISENSRLTTELAKCEYNIEKMRQETHKTSQRTFNEEELVELRLTVKAHLTQINILEERLKAAQARNDILEKEIDSRSSSDVDVRNERSRIQKELEALQALSRSLSTENKTLREEKMTLTEKVETLKSKITSRELQIRSLEDDLTEKDKQHEENLQKLEKESLTQGQRAMELEDLSRRVRELSESFTSETRKPRPRTSIHTISEEKETYKCSMTS
ncbi:unnamed protein product [Auanema sp. JU1783]|nr:unnamed protein product [Auanema sp. JU1783]